MILTKILNMLTGAATDAGASVSPEATAGATAGGIAELLVTLVPLLLMFVIFYFLLIRPQRKKDKKVKDMLAALKPGDRVCTIGGIYGTISSIKDETIELSVGKDNVKLVFARWGIRNVEEVLVENDSEALN